MTRLPTQLIDHVAYSNAVDRINDPAPLRSDTSLLRVLRLAAAGVSFGVSLASIYYAYTRYCKYRAAKQLRNLSWSVRRSTAVQPQQIADQLYDAFQTPARAWWRQTINYFLRPNQRGLLAVDHHSGEVIGSAFGDECDDDIVVCGPFSASPAHSDHGIARALIQQLVDECLQSNPHRALTLLVSPSNSKAFALYTKLGFEVRYNIMELKGFVAKPGTLPAVEEIEVKRLTPGDVDESAALLRTALSGICRRNYISNMARGQQLEPHGMGYVARSRSDGRIVGFTTAANSRAGFWCHNSVAAFQALYIHASHDLQTFNDAEKYTPAVLLPQAYLTELRWLLSVGPKITLQMNVMIRNEFAVRDGYGYCPSGAG